MGPHHKNVAQKYWIDPDDNLFFCNFGTAASLGQKPCGKWFCNIFIYIWNEIGIGRELIMADIWILVLFECFQSERSNWPSHDAHIVHIKTYNLSCSIFPYLYFESIEKAKKRSSANDANKKQLCNSIKVTSLFCYFIPKLGSANNFWKKRLYFLPVWFNHE